MGDQRYKVCTLALTICERTRPPPATFNRSQLGRTAIVPPQMLLCSIFCSMYFYAHSLPDNPDPAKWQTLHDHANAVALRAASFAAPFRSTDWAFNAGWLHDLGKLDSAFQGYLRRENGLDDSEYDSGRVNHSSAGAGFALEKLSPAIGKILSYLIAGHHAGLPDWATGEASLSIRKQEGVENWKRIEKDATPFVTALRPGLRPPEFLRNHPERLHLWVRMLFSCLVDADCLDTESFMDAARAQVREEAFLPLSSLKALFDQYMIEKARSAASSPINLIRGQILSACRTAALQNTGLFNLAVPTGGGKTLSSVAFALDHAMQHGMTRIIYVIPYTSIIEQTASILGGIFGPRNVVEHHSNLSPELETLRHSMATDNWDAPIIVTTNVQFFESLYAARPSRCRKLHNLVNSVILLDEAQLLPAELLFPCVEALNQLTRHYGSTVLFSTATMPRLPGLDACTEIISPSLNLYERLRRTQIHLPPNEQIHEPQSWETIAKELSHFPQVLCIVNTRKDCLELFNLMPEGTLHLSALMCGEHRSELITEIKARLAKGEDIRVISTQLVEAGVDIDFPVVYRAMAGLDSILQAAGRCNREGKQAKGGMVKVFTPPKRAPLGLLRKGEDTTRELASLGLDPNAPDSPPRYFELFYAKRNSTGAEQLHVLLTRDAAPNLEFQFRTAAEWFRLIDDKAQQPVIVRYGKSPELIDELHSNGINKQVMRRLQRFTVNVGRHTLTKMKTLGMVEELMFGSEASGICIQTLGGLYREQTGLNIFDETLPPEDLVV